MRIFKIALSCCCPACRRNCTLACLLNLATHVRHSWIRHDEHPMYHSRRARNPTASMDTPWDLICDNSQAAQCLVISNGPMRTPSCFPSRPPLSKSAAHLVVGADKVLDLRLGELAHAQQARLGRDLVAVGLPYLRGRKGQLPAVVVQQVPACSARAWDLIVETKLGIDEEHGILSSRWPDLPSVQPPE